MLETNYLVCPQLEGTHQMAPLLEVEEVKKVKVKQRTLKTAGQDNRRQTYEQLITGAGNQNGKEKAWASMVLLFCHDKMEPEERRRVEEIQLKFASLLQTYLNHVGKLEGTSREAAARTIVASTTSSYSSS